MSTRAAPLAPARRALGPLLGHLVLLAAATVVLLPFAWMVLTALRPPADVLSKPFGLPTDAGAAIANIRQAVTAVPMLRLLLNGVIVVGGIVTVQLLVAIPCAYALAKLRFPGRRLLFGLVLLALCVPVQVPMLPLYLGLARLHLLDSYAALMLPFLLSVFAVFLLRQHILGYPDAVLDAARLDGLTQIEILLRLVVPSARPAIAAFVVFSATAHWNDLFWPMIVVSSTDMATPPLGLLFFRDGELGANYGALMAAALIVTAPLVAAFFAAQRQFIRGIAMTGLR